MKGKVLVSITCCDYYAKPGYFVLKVCEYMSDLFSAYFALLTLKRAPWRCKHAQYCSLTARTAVSLINRMIKSSRVVPKAALVIIQLLSILLDSDASPNQGSGKTKLRRNQRLWYPEADIKNAHRRGHYETSQNQPRFRIRSRK